MRKAFLWMGTLLASVLFLAGSCDPSDLTLTWNGLEDFEGSELHMVLEPDPPSSNVDNVGPLSEVVGDDGSATIATSVKSDEFYDLYYYIDHNGNGTCDQDDPSDVKRHTTVPSNIEEMEIGYLSGVETPPDVCVHFDFPVVGDGPSVVESALEADLALEWTGFGDFPNSYIQARLATDDGYTIGPYEANIVGDNGISAVSEGYSGEHKWTIQSWVDVNNNFECDDDVDILQVYDLPLGATYFGMEYDSSMTNSVNCDSLSGFTNYDPPPNAP